MYVDVRSAYLNFLNESLAYDMFMYKFSRQNVLKLYANITQVLTDAKELNHDLHGKHSNTYIRTFQSCFSAMKKCFEVLAIK